MRRLWIGITLLALMLGMGLWLTAAFNGIHMPLAEQLTQAQEAALEGDWERAMQLTEKAQSRWQRYRHLTAAAADHEPLEEMDALFARLKVLGQLREQDEFSSDCAQLSRLAEAMAESQQLRWWSFL